MAWLPHSTETSRHVSAHKRTRLPDLANLITPPSHIRQTVSIPTRTAITQASGLVSRPSFVLCLSKRPADTRPGL